MLRKVVRLDKSEVSFAYDTFGRRIEKSLTGTDSDRTIRFLWDGNVPIHQWEEATGKKSVKSRQRIEYQADYVRKLSEIRQKKEQEKDAPGEAVTESLVTWIFQDDFVPRAKITKEGYYSIMTDYLGTPVEAYDEEGNLVWKRELDINGKVMPPGKDCYGRRMEETGDTGFIPFRFQGQYEDKETGLYYNRFRYYNPETGRYTQQDPIGLAGGNPTLYGYVWDTNWWIDPFGLFNIADFTGHPDLYPHPKSIITIKMMGSRKSDYTVAFKNSGIPSNIKGYTWHHVYDFDSTAGETTMQLIRTKTHEANCPHNGSVSQYEKAFGVKYETYEAKMVSYEKGWRKKKPKTYACKG